jgi:hypothetical protein
MTVGGNNMVTCAVSTTPHVLEQMFKYNPDQELRIGVLLFAAELLYVNNLSKLGVGDILHEAHANLNHTETVREVAVALILKHSLGSALESFSLRPLGEHETVVEQRVQAIPPLPVKIAKIIESVPQELRTEDKFPKSAMDQILAILEPHLKSKHKLVEHLSKQQCWKTIREEIRTNGHTWIPGAERAFPDGVMRPKFGDPNGMKELSPSPRGKPRTQRY